MTPQIPHRAEVPYHHTWSVEDIFADIAEWEVACLHIEQELPTLADFQGRLGESASVLLHWLHTTARMGTLVEKIYDYAQMCFDTDTTNDSYNALLSRVQSLSANYRAATAFSEPEILALGSLIITAFVDAEPQLALYRHYFDNLQRTQPYVRSVEIEDLLAHTNAPLSMFRTAYRTLVDGDLSFTDAIAADGQRSRVTRGTAESLLFSLDRDLRQTAWCSLADGFLSVRKTLAMLLHGYVQASVFYARSRRHPTALTATLMADNLPSTVYTNVLDTCMRHMPIWQRYWDIRRRALKLGQLESWDIFAPLSKTHINVPYTQAVEWICAGMQPLGEEYVRVLRHGLTDGRWVDIYPNQGKRGGAYSKRCYGTHPYILVNYGNQLISMSSLAHEIGHAMHAYLVQQHQPYANSHYSLFVAEVASNFNQALTRNYLLQTYTDRDFQIAVLEETMRNFHRYLFLMPILAQFERQIYEWVEQGQGLTADKLSNLLATLYQTGYGNSVRIDQLRVGIGWAQYPQVFESFYMYQYASGIAAANALADRVVHGESNAVEQYRTFLEAGDSQYPLDLLRLAGVDMNSPEPIEQAFNVLEGYIDRLDQLL